MSDEPTSDDTTPDDTTPEDTAPDDTTPGPDVTPDEPPAVSAPALDTDVTQPVVPASDPVPTQAAAPAAPAAPAERRGVFVPRWLAVVAGVVVAVLLVGGGGFALGRATADDDDATRAVPVPSAPAPTPRDDGPSTDDRRELPDLPDTPLAGSAYLGVSVDPMSDVDGVLIAEVVDGSPADDAGLEAGDVITEIDGEEVASFADLASVLADHDADDDVEVTYERDGETDTVTVTLGERPAGSSRPDDSGPSGSGTD